MIDDSALRALAARHGFSGRYRTWREGARSFAEVKATKNGAVVAWRTANMIAEPQAVFDQLVKGLADDLDATRRAPTINLSEGTER